MNLLTLPLVNPRHHIGKLKGFAYLLFEAFMQAYVDAYMKLLYPSCLVRLRHAKSKLQYNSMTVALTLLLLPVHLLAALYA